MNLYSNSVVFTASDTSAVLTPQVRGPLIAVAVPATSGITSLTLLFSPTEAGTFVPVKDDKGVDITITGIDASAAIYDLTNVFPAGVGRLASAGQGFLKLKANASVSTTVTAYFLGE